MTQKVRDTQAKHTAMLESTLPPDKNMLAGLCISPGRIFPRSCAVSGLKLTDIAAENVEIERANSKITVQASKLARVLQFANEVSETATI